MNLITPVAIPKPARLLTYDDRLLFVGSCFSDAVSALLAQYYFRLTANPFGTLYNPLSIAQAFCMQTVPPLVEYGGLWHSMAHHGAFSHPTEKETREAVGASVERMQEAVRKSSVVIVTFGTAWVYEGTKGQCTMYKGTMYNVQRDNVQCTKGQSTKDKGQVVANCHKMPAERFNRRRLSVDEIVAAWKPILEKYPDKYWIFTVSPIRHLKDGLHENQLSKATLLMAIEQLTANSQLPTAGYFPSYEIVQDELRDYRFYAPDLVHLNEMGVQYVFERFCDTFFSAETRSDMRLLHKFWQQSHHRLLHPESPESQDFMAHLKAQKQTLQTRFPWIE